MKVSDGIDKTIRWIKGAPSKQELAKSDSIKDPKDVLEKAQDGVDAFWDSRYADNTAKIMKPYAKHVKNNTKDPRVKLLVDTAMDVKTKHDAAASRARLFALKAALNGINEPATVAMAKVAVQSMTTFVSEARSIRGEPIYLDPNHKVKSGLKAFGTALADAFVLTDLDNNSRSVGKTFLKAIKKNSDNQEEVETAANALKSKGDSETVTEIYWDALNNIAGGSAREKQEG